MEREAPTHTEELRVTRQPPAETVIQVVLDIRLQTHNTRLQVAAARPGGGPADQNQAEAPEQAEADQKQAEQAEAEQAEAQEDAEEKQAQAEQEDAED